jgi:hypothetical protein
MRRASKYIYSLSIFGFCWYEKRRLVVVVEVEVDESK